MNGFLRATVNSSKKSVKNCQPRQRSETDIHVATSGFRKPFHDSTSSFRLKLAESVRIIIEACYIERKKTFCRTYETKQLETVSVLTESTDLISESLNKI
jgi:hypothetical protein